MLKKINLKVKTDLGVCAEVLSWFEQLNQPPLPDKDIWYKCQTLLWEAFTNIVEHAHKDLPPETPIDIEATRFERHIEIRIWCYGPWFNLNQKLQEIPEFEDNYNDRGRGLKIISMLADNFSYDQVNQRNCMFITKQY